MDKNPHEKPVDNSQNIPKPDTLGNVRPNDKYDSKGDEGYDKPSKGYLPPPSYENKPAPVSNQYLPPKPSYEKGDKVQTVVSVASGPDSYYHPVLNLLISDKDQYGQINDKMDATYNNGPPFRPETLYRPYDDHRPEHWPSKNEYDSKPAGRPSIGYDMPEPIFIAHEYKPDCDRDPPYNYRPSLPASYGISDTGRPKPDVYDRPDSSYGRPVVPKPRPDGYDRPDLNFDRPITPPRRPSGYDRPDSSYETPVNPPRRPEGYDRPDSYYDRPIGPPRQPEEYDRPTSTYERPIGPLRKPEDYDRPDPSFSRPLYPKPRPDGYDRPDPMYERPLSPRPTPDGYNRPNTDLRPIYSRPKPSAYGDPESGISNRPGSYYAPSYSGYTSNEYYSAFGISNIDRYDIVPVRPDNG